MHATIGRARDYLFDPPTAEQTTNFDNYIRCTLNTINNPLYACYDTGIIYDLIRFRNDRAPKPKLVANSFV